MAINEVFKRPTVKQVIFQIRYPNLFFIENKIGDIQLRIMELFPESALVFRRQIVVADIGPDVKLDELAEKNQAEPSKKIWQFKSPKGYQLNILSDSLDITSQLHKTYQNPGADHKFRDIIEYVLKHFFEVAQIPLINRVGLRYIDECPLPAKTTDILTEYYKTTFPTSRFRLEDASEMEFRTEVSRGEFTVRYAEKLLELEENNWRLLLDFDGFAYNVKAANCLDVADSLHSLISGEYEQTIKAPLYKYMRGESEL